MGPVDRGCLQRRDLRDARDCDARMSITAATPATRRRPAREYWHRKFIWRSVIQLEGNGGRYLFFLEPVLRRWSISKNRFLYLRLTPTRELTLIGTDKRIGE